jgi:Protein of unknown function (DUF3147)
MYFFLKTTFTALLISGITIFAKHYPKYGGIVAALPLVSLLSLFWLYIQGEQNSDLSQFLFGVLYGLPSTIILILVVAISLKHSIPFLLSIVFGIIGWGLFLFLQKLVLSRIILTF